MYFLRQRVILNNQIVLTIVWSVTTFTFYINNTFVKYMPGNFEENFLRVVTGDMIVTLVCSQIYQFVHSPKILIFAASAISATAMTCIVIFVDYKNPDWKVLVFAGLARAGIVSNFITLFISHLAFFPTLFAATSLGISYFIARSIVIMAPPFAEVASPLPEALVISLLIFNCLAVLCLTNERESHKK